MYIPRHAEATVKRFSEMFGAVLVAGPRQVGKTAMLGRVAEGVAYADMGDMVTLTSAQDDGADFFKNYPPPVFIDDIQRAPELFERMRPILKNGKKKGQFLMCAPRLGVTEGADEPLRRQIGLIRLLGLSMRETRNVDFTLPFVPTEEYFAERRKKLAAVSCDEAWNVIYRGGMPELCGNPYFDRRMFYGKYVRAYAERDVRELTEIADTVKFTKFMAAAAAGTGKLLNLNSLARDVGISQPTAERWMSILVASDIVYLLRPYSSSAAKRAVKTPKLYFLDTGLASYLTKWNTAASLRSSSAAGNLFESFVISEVVKSYCNSGILEPPIYFYRDKDMCEIELLIENDGVLHPLRIKKYTEPRRRDIDAFDVLEKLPDVSRGSGGIVCLCDRLLPLSGKDRAIPVNYL